MDSFDELAGFYDLDYPDTSDHAFLTRLVRAADPAHLLEVPCGSGRNVQVLLAAAARRVTFMDLAEPMARQAADRIPARERERARAVQGDIRSLPAAGEFDLVICPREAFQLLSASDAARALRSMATSVARDGLVVIDLFYFCGRPASPSDAAPDYHTPAEHGWVVDWIRTAADGSLAVTRRRCQRFTSGGAHFEMRYALRQAGSAEPRLVSLAFDMTNYTRDAFLGLVGRSGLAALAAFDGYDGYDGAAAAPPPLRTVFVLGHQGCQQAVERAHRVGKAVAAGRRAP